MDDTILVQRSLAGDTQALALLVDHYKGPVYNLAYRMLGNSEDAEDAAQETFLRAYRQLASYEPSRKFSSWLLSIAAHYCIDQLRRRRFTWLPFDELPFLENLASEAPEPEETLVGHEEQVQVRSLLKLLPTNYRTVIVLRYWYDMSYDEIAEITHLSEAAVKTRLHRAREMLSDHLAKTDPQLRPSVPRRHDENRLVSSALVDRLPQAGLQARAR